MGRVVLDELLHPRFADEEPEKYVDLTGKAGGELAMLLRMAKRALPADHHDEIHQLGRDLAPHARGAHVYRTILLRPSRAAMHALTHFCLTDIGIPDSEFDRFARNAFASSVRGANERVPYRMLDAAWTRHLAFGDEELDHPAIDLSPLAAGVDLIEASTNDAYAFTHSLPYATDFGRVVLPERLDRAMLLGTAEALAVKALDEDDLDLLAEVLMAPAILRDAWTPTLAFAWTVLDRVWTKFDFVPGPGLQEASPGETRTQTVRRVLGTLYHTTFAAGLCCATLAACQAPPPPPQCGPPGGSDPPPGLGTAWKEIWTESPLRLQESLVFAELAFALRRAVTPLDLASIYAVLTTAARCGLAAHPLFVQALELLERARARVA